MAKIFPVLTAICVLSTGFEATLAAAPTIEVRARTTIELGAVRRLRGGIQVTGRVLDANTGDAISGAAVRIAVAGLSEVVTSDDSGQFAASFKVFDERLDLLVQAGGPSLGDSRAELAGLEVSKQPLELSLTVGPVTAKEVTVVVRASSEDAATPDLDLVLEVDGEDLGVVTTSSSGRVERRIPRKGALGVPGRKTFVASFPGNDLYDPATAAATELLIVETDLEFDVGDRDVRFSETVKGVGALLDTAGRAVRDARIDLMAATGDVLASTMTDTNGRFAFEVEASELGPGELTIQAVFDSPQPWFESTRSKTITLSIAEPEPIPVAYTLGAFGITAFALLAFVGLRTKPWLRWRPDEAATDARAGQALRTRPVVGGMKPSRQSLISTIRRAHDFGFSARVRDAATGEVIVGAELTLELGDQRHRGVTSSNGTVVLENLAEGTWNAEARAKHFVSERFAATIPHRGELRGAEIDLVPVRERIFDMYKEAALPHLPRPTLWGIWTPRQIIDRVKRTSDAPALAQLTDFVEDAYFSQRTPVEAILPRAAELVAAAVAEGNA